MVGFEFLEKFKFVVVRISNKGFDIEGLFFKI